MYLYGYIKRGRALKARVKIQERLQERRIKAPFVYIKEPYINLTTHNEIEEEITALKVNNLDETVKQIQRDVNDLKAQGIMISITFLLFNRKEKVIYNYLDLLGEEYVILRQSEILAIVE